MLRRGLTIASQFLLYKETRYLLSLLGFLIINLLESLILAQDERWRRA
jgi:hypothetical protein